MDYFDPTIKKVYVKMDELQLEEEINAYCYAAPLGEQDFLPEGGNIHLL